MIKIAPSILSADFMRLGEEIKAVEDAGAQMLHIDVMDGHFVPNITIGSSTVESIRKITAIPLDVHLMIEEPDSFLESFIAAGADMLTVHFETCVHLHRTIQTIKENGIKAGVSLNPATPILNLEDILDDLDIVLVMSVNPGFGGQTFIPHSIEKIKLLKKMIGDRGMDTLIEVDGGVKLENAKEIADAGAEVLVMGSAFFGVGNYKTLMEKLDGTLGNR